MSSVQFNFMADLDAHLESGWGVPELAGDDEPEERDLILPATSAQVSRHLAALQWPADYLCRDRIGSARMLGLWAACKVLRRSFAGAVKARGVARRTAYQLRDRGLSLISQGLDRDRVSVESLAEKVSSFSLAGSVKQVNITLPEVHEQEPKEPSTVHF